MNDLEKALTECIKRSQLLEEKVQDLKRQIEATKAKIAAVEAKQKGWHWTELERNRRRDN